MRTKVKKKHITMINSQKILVALILLHVTPIDANIVNSLNKVSTKVVRKGGDLITKHVGASTLVTSIAGSDVKNVQTSLIDVPPSSLRGNAILTMKKLYNRKESTFDDALFNKLHDDTFSERNIAQKRNRRLTTDRCLNGLLLAPIRLHLVALTLLAVCVSIVRLDPVAQALESLLYVVDLTKNGGTFPAVNFQPLSMLNHVTHVTLLNISIEFAYSFYLLNKIHPNKTAKKKYARFCTVFFIYDPPGNIHNPWSFTDCIQYRTFVGIPLVGPDVDHEQHLLYWIGRNLWILDNNTLFLGNGPELYWLP